MFLLLILINSRVIIRRRFLLPKISVNILSYTINIFRFFIWIVLINIFKIQLKYSKKIKKIRTRILRKSIQRKSIGSL